MKPTMRLEVITPDNEILDTETGSMRVLLPDGWWGILPGHAPMISYIHSGVIHYTREDQTRYIALYQGTIEVKQKLGDQTHVLILTAAAEEGDDLENVQMLLEQQATRLEELAKEADVEFQQIRLSLEKSLQKLNVTDVSL
ncbi:MAG: F0F1 ATP synthase subunit epsilon [Anaerolineales bacterium]